MGTDTTRKIAENIRKTNTKRDPIENIEETQETRNELYIRPSRNLMFSTHAITISTLTAEATL